jgi:sulfite exporter TauE/SafE
MEGSLILAGFLAGLMGSVHCLGMCSGLSGLFAIGAGDGKVRVLTYNAGRLFSYSLIGAIGGWLGASAADAYQLYTQVHWLRIAGGIIICLIGLQILLELNLLRAIESAGAGIWRVINPLAKRFLPVTSHRRALGLGLLWGWLPCGLVYSVLLVSMTSGGAGPGALVMAAFGAGTLPAMLATGMGAQAVTRFTRGSFSRRATGAVLIVMGLLTIVMPLGGSLAGGHGH